MQENVSLLFRSFLFFLTAWRRPYLAAWRRWPGFFEKRLAKPTNLITSRMLSRFNWLHQAFFHHALRKIRFDPQDIADLRQIYDQGPVVFLMRNWGQVEYNAFNHLFLSQELPLVQYNNLIKMAHWMPLSELRRIWFHKIHHFMTVGHWPYNSELFDLAGTLSQPAPVLFCLDLPQEDAWMEHSFAIPRGILRQILTAQNRLDAPIQLVPIHFIYDKHPQKTRRSLGDILFGDPENPDYLRKISLFLRNYKKRLLVKIGAPLDLSRYADTQSGELLREIQKKFDLESKQVTGPKLKPRRKIILELTQEPGLSQELSEVAAAQNLPLETATEQFSKALREIAGDISFKSIEICSYVLHWVFHRFFEGLVVDRAGLSRIKKNVKGAPMIFAPAHRSHIDYMLLAYLFYENDLSLPYVAAGNNLAFWPLGSFFRKSSAYFIRRSFSGDKIYALALKKYVEFLMKEGYFQEFFIEGTRSRSGKLFPPKLGLLKMMLEAVEEGKVPDAYFVPVSIDYEKILEESSYLQETGGRQKQKERIRDLLKLPRFLIKRYGKVYVQFSEPISFREHRESLGHPDFDVVAKSFAERILRSIQQVTTVTPLSLVANALLSSENRSPSAAEVQEKTRTLLEIARTKATHASQQFEKTDFVAETLEQACKEKWLEPAPSADGTRYQIPNASRRRLDFLKNQNLAFFVDEALAANCRGSATLWAELRELLSREFFLPEKTMPRDFSPPSWFAEMLKPILGAYWLTLCSVETLPSGTESWLFVRKTLELGEQCLLRGELRYPESLSRFAIQNAVQKFIQYGILQESGEKIGAKKLLSPGPQTALRDQWKERLHGILH